MLFDRGLSTGSLEPRRIMDELQYSMGDDLRYPSEDAVSVTPTLKPRVGYCNMWMISNFHYFVVN